MFTELAGKIRWLGAIGNMIANRSRMRFNLGVGLIFCALFAGLFFRIGLIRSKKAKWAARGLLLAGIIITILSFSNGDGHGIGTGDGSGIGLTDETGISWEFGKDEKISFFNDLTPEQLQAAENAVRAKEKVSIRVEGEEVYIENVVFQETEDLEKAVKEWITDETEVEVVDYFADYERYMQVTDVLAKCGIDTFLETTRTEKEGAAQ